MIKPVKKYDVKYPKNCKRKKETTEEKREIYMCEHIDVYVKRPLMEDDFMSSIGM